MHYHKAQSHARASAAESKRMNIKAIYRIYDFDDLVEMIDSEKIEFTQDLSNDAAGASSGQTKRFNLQAYPI